MNFTTKLILRPRIGEQSYFQDDVFDTVLQLSVRDDDFVISHLDLTLLSSIPL